MALGTGATDVAIEGQWLVNGVVQGSASLSCNLRFYDTEGATSALWTTNGVPFATDVNGCFVICVSSPTGVSLPDTFWVGVTPAGQDEISPRFRIAPAPFAFAADEVKLVSTEKEIELTGVATVDSLSVAGNVNAKDFVVMADGVVKTTNLQLDSAKVLSLSMPNAGMLGLFNARGATPSFDYDVFSAEKEAGVEAFIESSGSMFTHDHSRDRSADYSYTFDGDGFLLIAIKADSKQCPASKLSVKIGVTKVYDRAVGTDKGGVVKRFMTVPYRSGEAVRLVLTAVGGGEIPYRQQDSYRSYIGVKLRLVKFGRD